MCGRFAFYSPAEAAVQLFGVAGPFAADPRYNIAPTQYVVAVRDTESGDREAVSLKWGLIPFWAKDPAIGNRMINARAETVAEKPAYRNAFRHRRAVVLADGFYEWRRDGSTKTPYFITTGDDQPFGLAALWESWTDKQTGEHIESTTLITTAADDYIAQLHHRMPVTLDPGLAAEWLAGNDDLIGPGAPLSPPLVAWPVDKRVNNARNEGEDLIDAAGEPLPR
jgi:putative SOS response-associated peptidase YedK